ncbi:MAG: hypothetical protein IPO70_15870 [Bacteroidetes bacterium]|nr:hypothetical protein [Bacteroidota bacterium]
MIDLGIGSRVQHPGYGDGVVINVKRHSVLITFMNHGIKEIPLEYDGLSILDKVEPDADLVSLWDIEQTLVKVIKEYVDYPEKVELGNKWTGGKVILQPADTALTVKEIPIESLFRKIVLIRDRMRTLEQRVNSNDKLEDEEKINLQQYITKVYGSLTTFNVLFKNAEDQFRGEKGKE